MGAFHDLTGSVFARLTVLGLSNQRSGTQRKLMWRCRCQCGNDTTVIGENLRSGRSKSCGCLNIETRRTAPMTHGATVNGQRSRENVAWKHMIQRCTNPKAERYPRYGGRGISVCPEWRASFARFLADMGPCPPGYELDRINNNGNYEPSNCRWASDHTQRRNTSRNRMLTLNDETLCFSDWATRTGWTHEQLRTRLKRLPIERALEPAQHRHGSE